MNFNLLPLSIISALLLSGCGGSDDDPTPADQVSSDPVVSFPMQTAAPSLSEANDLGTIYTSADGLSLYTFDNDSLNNSNCNGAADNLDSCAGKWPPLLAAEDSLETTMFTFVSRDDGSKQWAYKGMPVYTFFQDSAQGDVTGDGINDIWHLSRPMPLITSNINELATYVSNQTSRSVSSTGEVLETVRLAKDGFTLYTFDKDMVGQSACAGDCLNVWLPLLADEGAMAQAPLSILSLENGNKQWAYKGKALYLFANDSAAGDTKGDGVKDIWHTATKKPAVYRLRGEDRILTAFGQLTTLEPDAENTDKFISVIKDDKDGLSLYTFDNDSELVSNCSDTCLENWPPLLADDTAMDIGDYKKFSRTDGSMQWAYKGQPLYFFKNDLAIGDINGEGLNGVWHLIKK